MTGEPPQRLVHRPHLGPHRRPRLRGRRASTGSPTPTTTTCPTGASTSGRQQLIIPYTPRDQRHALLGRHLPHRARTSSPTSATPSTPSTPKARPARPKMMSVGLHCRLVGRPGRIKGLADFIDHVQATTSVWIATRVDIAAHWRARHPAPADRRPPDRRLAEGRLRRPLRRHLRALPLDRRARLRPRARPRPRHRRRPRQRARPRLPLGQPRTSASASSRPTPTSPASSPPPSA